MTKTKRFFTSLISLALILCTMFTMIPPVSAATRSNGTETRTIYVQTKANYLRYGSESITLKQTKGVCEEYNFFTKKTKTSKQYGEWEIVAKADDGSHTVKATLSGSSVKIKLKPNKSYTITVTWDSTANLFTELDHGSFVTYPTWCVKSINKISYIR